MKLRKRLIKYVIILFCLPCLIAAIQTGTAIYFSKSEVKVEPADLVVVFPGEKQRIVAGIERVKVGIAAHIMEVGTTHVKLSALLQNSGVSGTVSALPGGKSRSTFEDVYQTAKTIKENHLSSVIVVTSSYHLPRALFLLKAYLKISGQDVRIQGFPVKEPHHNNKELKQYSSEVIKLWGNVFEMASCYFTGDLVLDAQNLRKIQTVFKKNYLW